MILSTIPALSQVNWKTVSNFFGVSQNNFISGTDVDSVDEYVFVLYSNGIFIIHYLSLERIVCYSIRLVSLSSVKSPKNELHYELSQWFQNKGNSTSVKLIKIYFLFINIYTMLRELLTRIKNNQLVKMSKCLEKHIKILWLDLRTSEWKNLHGSVHFEFLFYT